MSAINESRREFLKIAGYAAPVILTLSAMPAYAQSGSGVPDSFNRGGCNNGLGNSDDCPPPGIEKQGLPQNDEIVVAPGDPDYKGGGPK